MLTPRRSTRTRKQPKAIYEVEDRRKSGGDDAGSEEEEDVDDDAEEPQEEMDTSDGEDDAFVPAKVKTPTKPRQPKRKIQSNGVMRPRKLKPVMEERRLNAKKRKQDGVADGVDGNANAGEDVDEDEEESVLFEAVKRGTASFRNLLIEWRDRYDEDKENATREVLNFVLQACGGTGQCVPDTVKIDQLDMSDLVDYVVGDLERENEDYPIASRLKSYKKFQRHFVEFWEAFIQECTESELLFTSDLIATFVDWLTTLSSAEVRAIRHTCTIAALGLGNALVDSANGISQHLSVVTRQLNAENSTPRSKKDKTNARKSTPVSKKIQLLEESKRMYEGRLQQVLHHVNLLFTGVVVHRYRDVMPEIRMESIKALSHWIVTLPDHYLQDNFLKYLGWMLNDKNAPVRLCVVEILRGLYENEAFAPKLEMFTSRFLPRYLELCKDVDDRVVHECIYLLIAVDKRSLVSSDVQLQAVEKLVFDDNNVDIRKAAAEFVCLQYDAFGVAESKKNSNLTRDQLNTQAIALVEFAEEYIHNHNVPAEAIETLVDAFWGLEDCRVLQDWKLQTNLLLMDKSAPDLTNEQQTILIRILVASVRKICAEESSERLSTVTKKKTTDKDEITLSFSKDLPNLLVLYQSDAEKLSLLVELVPMLTLTSEIVTRHIGHIKDLLEKLKFAYLAHSEEKLLMILSHAIKHLFQTEHEVVKREAEVIIHEIFQDIVEKMQQSLEDDARIFEEMATADGKKGKGKKRKSSGKKKELIDVEYALRLSLCRVKCMTRYLNILEYLPSSSSSSSPDNDRTITDPGRRESRMDAIASALVGLIHRRTRNILLLDKVFCQADTIKHSLMVLYSQLLWLTRPIFKVIDTSRKDGSEEVADDDSIGKSVQDQIQYILQARSSLEEAVISVLEMHLDKTKESNDDGDESHPSEMHEIAFEDEDISEYVVEAQRFAFVTFCDTRCLFVDKFQDSPPPYDALDWTLPRILVLLTQMYFENEMESGNVEEHEEEETTGEETLWEKKQRRKAELLVALGKVSLSNPSNKRQAAAVLQHFVENGTHTIDVVKAFSKQVKTETPVRYLEIQMTALRRLFASILTLKDELAEVANLASDENEGSIEEDIKESIRSSEAELKDLAKKFSQSLGVGKVVASLRAPFFRFLCEGVRFSLERQQHFSFLDSLRPYLSHLDISSMKQLRSYFMQLLENFDDVPGDEENLDSDWRILFDFQSAVTSKTGKRELKSADSMTSPSLKRRRSESPQPTPIQAATIVEVDDDNEIESVTSGKDEVMAVDKSKPSRQQPKTSLNTSGTESDNIGNLRNDDVAETILDGHASMLTTKRNHDTATLSSENQLNPCDDKETTPSKKRKSVAENAEHEEEERKTDEDESAAEEIANMSDDDDEIDSRRTHRRRRSRT